MLRFNISIVFCSLDFCAEKEIVAFDPATGIAILYLLVVVEDGRLQRSAHCWSVMAVFHGLEGESAIYFRTIIFFFLNVAIVCKSYIKCITYVVVQTVM